MKQFLLPFLLFLITLTAFGQTSSFSQRLSLQNGGNNQGLNITVYPNPATSHIGITNGDEVTRILIFNMVGRKMKSYDFDEAVNHYFVGDLPTGMYLVQLLGTNNEVIITKRVNKR